MQPEELLKRWEHVIVAAVNPLPPDLVREKKEQFFHLVGFPPLPEEEHRRLQLFLEYLVLEMEVQGGYTPLDLLLRSPSAGEETILDAERFHRSHLVLVKIQKLEGDQLSLKELLGKEQYRAKPPVMEGFSRGMILITRIIPYERENFLPATTEILESQHLKVFTKFLASLPSVPPRELCLISLLWNHLVRQFPAARGDDLLQWYKERLQERRLLFAPAN